MKRLLIPLFMMAFFVTIRPAHAAPCDSYTRNVVFPNGSQRLAQGTACLAHDGQWRVIEEHLTPAALYPRAYYGPYYYPAYYPRYSYYNPYPVFLSFGYGWGWGHGHHRHHHW